MDEASEGSTPEIAALMRSLERCKSRMEAISSKHRAINAMLVHHSRLGNKPDWPLPKNFETQGHWMLCSFSGPYQDVKQLFTSDGEPAIGEKPYCDVDGNPMVYSDGKPVAMYPGAQRMAYFWGPQIPNESEFIYSESISAIESASEELGRLLVELPIEVKEVLWREWQHGYHFTESKLKGIWIDAVFELAFQRHKYSGLSAERFIWAENKKLGCARRSDFRLPFTTDADTHTLYLAFLAFSDLLQSPLGQL